MSFPSMRDAPVLSPARLTLQAARRLPSTMFFAAGQPVAIAHALGHSERGHCQGFISACAAGLLYSCLPHRRLLSRVSRSLRARSRAFFLIASCRGANFHNERPLKNL
jgi:hypothetical protein